MRAGILFGGVIVMAVGVMVVAAVRVSFFKKLFLSVTKVEVEWLEVSFGLLGGDIFDLARDFVAMLVEMEVDDLELKVGVVARLVWGCLNERLYFL